MYRTFVSESLNLDPDQVSLDDIQNSLSKDSIDDDAIQEGFDMFILIKTLGDCVPSVQEIVSQYEDKPYFIFFQHNTGFLEILLDPETLNRVYFPIKPVCRYLSK